MTPEQVSALSDTELNRAMIWLYYTDEIWTDYESADSPFGVDNQDQELIFPINYLEDWSVTMPLAVENELNIDFINSEGFKSCDAMLSPSLASQDVNPLRAICEVLVLIKCQN